MSRLAASLAVLACLGLIAIQMVQGESATDALEVVASYEVLQGEVEEPQLRNLREAKKCEGRKCNRKKIPERKCKCKNGKKAYKCCKKRSIKGRRRCNCKNGKKSYKCCKTRSGKPIQKCACKKGKNKAKCCKTRSGTAVTDAKQACDEKKLCQKIKDFIKYSNQLRKIKRISKKCKQMENKKKKAATEFKNASEAISDSDDAEVKDLHEKLKNCSKTAAAGCEKTSSDGCKIDDKLKECKTALEAWLKSFGPGKGSCITASDSCCACITGLPDVKPECLAFDALNDDAVKKAKSCADTSKDGSFGNCKKLIGMAAVKGPKHCKKPTTLGGGGGTQRMALRRKLLQKWIKT